MQLKSLKEGQVFEYAGVKYRFRYLQDNEAVCEEYESHYRVLLLAEYFVNPIDDDDYGSPSRLESPEPDLDGYAIDDEFEW